MTYHTILYHIIVYHMIQAFMAAFLTDFFMTKALAILSWREVLKRRSLEARGDLEVKPKWLRRQLHDPSGSRRHC